MDFRLKLDAKMNDRYCVSGRLRYLKINAYISKYSENCLSYKLEALIQICLFGKNPMC